MIFVRRALALALVPLCGVAFVLALLVGRVDATVLDGDFIRGQAEDADLFALLHEEGIPAFVDEFVREQEEALPEHLRDADLPTDAEARARMAEVLQTLLPPAFMRDLADIVLDGVFPYVLGETDGFEQRISLHDPLVATFGAPLGGRSVFEVAWHDLDMSERLVRSFSEAAAGEDGDVDGEAEAPADPDAPPALLEVLAEDVEGASAWWDEQFLGLIDGLLPFLVGDSEELDLHIDFTDYPELAHAFAQPLRSDVRTLQTEGRRFTDEDLRARLAEAEELTMEDVDQQLAIFRPEGLTFTHEDFMRWVDEQRQAALDDPNRSPEDAPPDFAEQRPRIRIARLAGTWGATAVAALLVLAVAFLGGRTWAGRVGWGSASLLAASTLALVLTVPVWALTADHRIEDALDDLRAAGESNVPLVVREAVAEAALGAVHDFVAGMQWRAAGWFVLSALALAFAVAWHDGRFRTRVRRMFGGDGGTGLTE